MSKRPSDDFKTYDDYLNIEAPESKRRREAAEAREKRTRPTTVVERQTPAEDNRAFIVYSTGGSPTVGGRTPVTTTMSSYPKGTQFSDTDGTVKKAQGVQDITDTEKTEDTILPKPTTGVNDTPIGGPNPPSGQKKGVGNIVDAAKGLAQEGKGWKNDLGTISNDRVSPRGQQIQEQMADGDSDERYGVRRENPEEPLKEQQERQQREDTIQQNAKRLAEEGKDWKESPGVKVNDGGKEESERKDYEDRKGQVTEVPEPTDSDRDWLGSIGYNGAWGVNKIGSGIQMAGKAFGMLNGLVRGVLNRNLLSNPASPATAMFNVMQQSQKEFFDPVLEGYAKENNLVATRDASGWKLNPDLEGTYHGGKFREKEMQLKGARQKFNTTVDDALKYAMGDEYQGQDMSDAITNMTPEQLSRFEQSIQYAFDRDTSHLDIRTGPDGKRYIAGDFNDGDKYTMNAYGAMLDTAKRLVKEREKEQRRQSTDLRNQRKEGLADIQNKNDKVRASVEEWMASPERSVRDRLIIGAVPEFAYRMANGQYKVDENGDLDMDTSHFDIREWNAIYNNMRGVINDPNTTEEERVEARRLMDEMATIKRLTSEKRREETTSKGQWDKAWREWYNRPEQTTVDVPISAPHNEEEYEVFFNNPRIQRLMFENLEPDYVREKIGWYSQDDNGGITGLNWDRITDKGYAKIYDSLKNKKDVKGLQLSPGEEYLMDVAGRFSGKYRRKMEEDDIFERTYNMGTDKTNEVKSPVKKVIQPLGDDQ